MIRAAGLLGAGAIGFLALVGCGPNCQSTCAHVYNTCRIDKPGQTEGELIRDCTRECESAMLISGEIGDYDPERRRSSAASIELENEVQAAAWMDCVWGHAPDATEAQCQDLDPTSGYCAPI